MSGIFGIFNRDGKPIDKRIVETMLDTMSNWEADEKGEFINGPVALGHAMLWNTPESKYEHLPLENDAYVLTMDARIDNRDELLEQLELPARTLSEIGDSEFILASYKKWGKECPKYLLGDFAFAIWDKKNQQLFCARDHVGIKPFYYYSDDEIFVFSNDMKCITEHPDIDNSLNLKSIAYYLRGEEYRHHHTFINNIEKLLPGTSLVITSKEIKKSQYWSPENTPPICLGSTQEYVHKLTELLEQSVKARLRSIYPITSHLSGGLDSSGVATIASRLLKKENKKLISFNWVPRIGYDENPEYFEWGYSKLIAENEDIQHHYIEMNEIDLAKIFMNLDITTNDTVDLWYEYILRDIVQERDSRVILSGWGGDELVSSYGVGYVEELFFRGKFFQVIKKIKKPVKNTKNYFIQVLKRCIYMCVWQFLPNNVRCVLRKVDCYKPLTLCCIKKDFLKYISNVKPLKDHLIRTSVRKFQLSYLKMGHLQQRTESWSVSSKKNKIEYRYPLLDKRLIEFIINIPSELFISGDTNRFIYREAMKGILPEIIRLNREKDEPKRVKLFHEMTMKALLYALENEKLTENNYIDQDLLRIRIKEIDLSKYRTRDEIVSAIESIQRAFFVMNMQ